MKKSFIAFLIVFVCLFTSVFAQIPVNTLIQIVKAEDERRFDATLVNLMKSKDAKIRTRAALAAGRIGNDAALPDLIALLEKDSSAEVLTTAAFAIGEIESIKGADAILKVLNDAKTPDQIRARAVESAGKIAAANAKDEKSKTLGAAILEVLEAENKRGNQQNRETVLLGITAALRVRPEKTDVTVAKFLTNADARIRTDAGNTLARVRAKNANEIFRKMLVTDENAEARANAARALGAAEDKEALDILLKAATEDEDSRVRVSAIRSLGSLKDAKSADKLIERGETLYNTLYGASTFAPNNSNPSIKNEWLEIATVLGRLLANTNNEKAINFLQKVREFDEYHSPETEIAFSKIAPEKYLKEFNAKNNGFTDWRTASSYAQGLGDLATQTNEEIKKQASQTTSGYFMDFLAKVPPAKYAEMNKAAPDLLRAVAAFKHENLPLLLLEMIKTKDVFIRATAAELIGELPKSKENIKALQDAFNSAFVGDKDYNDAQLAILDALFKLDKNEVIPTLFVAMNSKDYLVRKKAADILQNSEIEKDDLVKMMLERHKSSRRDRVLPCSAGLKLGQVLNKPADYLRAVSRKNGNVKAVLTTEKGTFTIEFFPEDAPLTVDNFIKLAKANYFNGLQVHRVVPNFVMQDGDPRGDGNGGPGWSIRCEINMIEYSRGAVGMALSGKDTGGSQWFATHSPQPHLDGGYTVFGRVNETDMKIVDQIVRGDKILKVVIVEGKQRQKPAR